MCPMRVGFTIAAPSTSYVVEKNLGSGTFGEVNLCRKTCDQQVVALKVVKRMHYNTNAKGEAKILKMLKHYGSEKHNIVQLLESFEYGSRYCIAFECLDIDLFTFIIKSPHVTLKHIRPVIQQLATALKFLKSLRIIHADLKPENVMFVDHKSSLQVKIIDFGLAHRVFDVTPGEIIQTSWYRAPEVFVGIRYDEAVDIWSLGCVAVEMLGKKALFHGSCSPDMVRHIVKTLGNPPTDILCKGMYTKQYFNLHMNWGSPVWRLKMSPEEAYVTARPINKIEDLYQIDHEYNKDLTIDKKLDFEYFVNLVSRMLQLNPAQRITPEEILQHPFITMTHIVGVFETKHVRRCVEMMHCGPEQVREWQDVNVEQPSTSNCNKQPSKKRSCDADDEEARVVQNRPKCLFRKRKKVTFSQEDEEAPSISTPDAPKSGSKKFRRKRLMKRRKETRLPQEVTSVSDDRSTSSSSPKEDDMKDVDIQSVSRCVERMLCGPDQSREQQAVNVEQPSTSNCNKWPSQKRSRDVDVAEARVGQDRPKCLFRKKKKVRFLQEDVQAPSNSTPDAPQSSSKKCRRKRLRKRRKRSSLPQAQEVTSVSDNRTTSSSSPKEDDMEDVDRQSVSRCVERMPCGPGQSREQQAVNVEQPSTSNCNKRPSQKRRRDADDEETSVGQDRPKRILRKKKKVKFLQEEIQASSSSTPDAPQSGSKKCRRKRLRKRRKRTSLPQAQAVTSVSDDPATSSSSPKDNELEDVRGQSCSAEDDS